MELGTGANEKGRIFFERGESSKGERLFLNNPGAPNLTKSTGNKKGLKGGKVGGHTAVPDSKTSEEPVRRGPKKQNVGAFQMRGEGGNS